MAVEAPGFPSLATELALLGCRNAGAAANLVVLQCADRDATALARRLEPFAAAKLLALLPANARIADLERELFAAGWRFHPGALTQSTLHQLAQGGSAEISFYERAPAGYEGILTSRGTKALSSLGRWLLASERVRAGDRVLVVGPETEEGQAIFAARTRAAAVEVGPQPVGERRFDLVVAMNPSGGWNSIIADCAAMLKRDGRLVIGWDEVNPDRPPSWSDLEEVVTDEFLIEGYFAQPNGQVVPQAVVPAGFDLSGWRIVVAAMNPIEGEAESEGYAHPAFGRSQAQLVDFGGGYDNPWLYRTMVQMGERLTDDTKLARLAEYVATHARPGSADQGAALAVLGYRILENRATNVVPMLMGAIGTYCAGTDDNPHAVRWRVSLAFLGGRLCELVGDAAAARSWYGRAASDDWKIFSNILATKAIGAAFYAARLSLAEGDPASAWTWFERGVEVALEAAGRDHRAELGTGDGLLPFYLPELAEVIDMGSQCANALANRHLWERDPGLFWRQVDVKRFGLASWAIDMARENARLRQQLGCG